MGEDDMYRCSAMTLGVSFSFVILNLFITFSMKTYLQGNG
jgi:hypothetical protein